MAVHKYLAEAPYDIFSGKPYTIENVLKDLADKSSRLRLSGTSINFDSFSVGDLRGKPELVSSHIDKRGADEDKDAYFNSNIARLMRQPCNMPTYSRPYMPDPHMPVVIYYDSANTLGERLSKWARQPHVRGRAIVAAVFSLPPLVGCLMSGSYSYFTYGNFLFGVKEGLLTGGSLDLLFLVILGAGAAGLDD